MYTWIVLSAVKTRSKLGSWAALELREQGAAIRQYAPMGVTHIFVSHAGPDAAIATQLTQHLRDAGRDTKVDTLNLSLGDNTIDFMNEGIANAHTVVVLFSRHSANAKWQKLEIDSAVWNEVAQSGGRCIVVRLDDTDVPPILGPKVYGTLDPSDFTTLGRLVDAICDVALPLQTASSVIAQALRPASRNPFRHLRAEFFENRPDLHAKAFAPPDALTVGALEEMKPCFVEGSRGTGKSMLLLSLRARNFELRNKGTPDASRIFGFYLKLTRGAICNAGISSSGDSDPLDALGVDAAQLTDIAAQEIIVQIIESLFSELTYCFRERLVCCDPLLQRPLAEAADLLLFDATKTRAVSLDELLDKLADSHKRIADFIRRRFIYSEHPTVPVATFDFDQLKRVLKLVRRYVPSLKDSMFVVLLDEYENLFRYQQRIVNGLVKLGPPDVSVKIGKKLASGDTSGTSTGQELQETHDYTRLPLVYDVEDVSQRRVYQEHLRLFVRNICRCENLDSVDANQLLPEDTSAEVPEAKLMLEIAKLCKVTREEFDAWPEERRREKSTYYREAATYRVLFGGKGRHAEKRFSGFDELAFLSSGVIRYFQEILGVAYHLTFGAEAPETGQLILPPENQSRAVHFVSQHNLTTLSRNVERHGEELKYFLLDLGDCLRHKLLRHTSEPEAARLTIEDPERLAEEAMGTLRLMLALGAREGVFQTKEGLPAFKPKHSSDPQPSEFNVCRIYAPVLEISPRLRWRTGVKCRALLQLLLPGCRAQAMQELKAAMVREKPADQQAQLGLAP
ncbi:MAG: toll/interleukin-1 receptor domain-containing protein [Terriglobia bacterium]